MLPKPHPSDRRPASAGPARRVLAVSGLTKESAIASRPGIVTVAGGGRVALLRERLQNVDPTTLSAVVSFGVAGALAADLPVGTVVLATVVQGSPRPVAPAPALLAALRGALGEKRRAWREGVLIGVDHPVMTAADKAALALASGASVVDMESHVAAEWAEGHGLPFAAIRVVSDSASHTLPPLAATAMRPDGSIDLRHVLTELVRSPGQLPALIATGRDAAAAFRVLRGVGSLLGDLVGLDL